MGVGGDNFGGEGGKDGSSEVYCQKIAETMEVGGYIELCNLLS